MAYTVTFTAETLCNGAVRAIGDTLSVADDTARMLVDLGVATASGLTPQTGSAAAQFADTFAARASNLTDISSASSGRTALGLGTIATEDASTYLTTASASSTYQTVLSTSTTSTEGKIQLATPLEALIGTDISKAITSDALTWRLSSLGNWDLFASSGSGSTSGTGAQGTWPAGGSKNATSPTTAIGYGISYYLNYFISGNSSVLSAGYNAAIQWSSPQMLSYRMRKSASGVEATNVLRALFGGRPNSSITTTGNLTSKGLSVVQSGNGNFIFYAHNGSGLASVDTGIACTINTLYDFVLISDGLGNAYCYINGTLRATITGSAPVGIGAALCNVILFEAENTAIVTTNTGMQVWNCFLQTGQ